ncbi:LysR family transcriptional regulator [Alteromonas portus]|uniref:LysR family transcriptional regulator n=1 Tax=Alteromonas portus TaxID=2565549 RepID=A0A4U0Z9Y3_9ALTE|nr:LysR family transcriptional regulator [Alteromonas portus]TKB02861.1 LysR family transcriptional regulator [Alteromonas portus]
MDIEDLRKFIVVAQHENLNKASMHLSVTTGALSKVVKRIEQKLESQLFDRVGKHIRLNQRGNKFLLYATHLVHEADQALSEFRGNTALYNITVSGPSLLLQYCLPTLLAKPSSVQDRFHININACWEGKALESISRGGSDVAIATSFAMEEREQDPSLHRISLGSSTYVVVAAKNHPAVAEAKNGTLTSQSLYAYAFACPDVSPFCGIKRGIGSDGWRDDKVPRSIHYRCNDFGTLLSIVRQGLALAYVPDFIPKSHDLTCVSVSDYDFCHEEHFELIYKPSMASGWLNRFVDSVKSVI